MALLAIPMSYRGLVARCKGARRSFNWMRLFGNRCRMDVGVSVDDETFSGVVEQYTDYAYNIAYRMLKSIDNYQVEVLITLALVFTGYAGAEALHLSAPIGAVAAGLLIGNHGRMFAMSDKTTEHVDTFWELIDEILNAVLFVLLGLELILLKLAIPSVAAGLLSIPVVLLARVFGVGIPIYIRKLQREFSPNIIKILTWGGLRGGISVAMALSLPVSPERDVILVMTYIVVVFSVLVQGLSIGAVIKRGLAR
ncbi:MAG: cation:proton antiporter [Nitrospinae bacterium]|nr:cation:proton antiporter [Nitrospinota bacterium]